MISLVAVLATVLGQSVDFAQAAHVDDWLRHPVYGDPSFDSFTRAPGNPLLRGAPPHEWPVNGFLFEDPKSGNWYVYVGLYPKNYAADEGKTSICEAYRSTDRGASWERIGSVFPKEPFYFRGDKSPVGNAPDVSVVYADGAYHMIYDYSTSNSTWATIMEPAGGADNGIAYARATQPEGPFITTQEPVYRTSAHPVYRGKYRRGYAASLVRRKDDWMVLAMTDSGPNFSWALFGMSAKSPEGPYSEPVFLRAVEDAYYHPPLMEFFPAFAYEGRVYAPATSVALNRNFQGLFSAPLDRAMDPAAWELTRAGSVWHSEDVENESYGIWGQTFTGFVDKGKVFHVMFPSRDRDGMGTINLASRPWENPLRDGFVLTGHHGPSLTLLRRTGTFSELELDLSLRGTATLLLDYRAPLGPNKPSADATLHPLSLTRYRGIELDGKAWHAVNVDDKGKRGELASGALPEGPVKLKLSRGENGALRLQIGGADAWKTGEAFESEALGLLVGKDSHLEVSRFAVKGETTPAHCALLYTDAILGAGAAKDSWKTEQNVGFRYGEGAASLKRDAMAKWNFEGSGCALWCPRGPGYGKADLWLDGQKVETLNLHADTDEPSAQRFTQTNLSGRQHTLIVRPAEGTVPLDSLDVTME
jgi:hypothetical protein